MFISPRPNIKRAWTFLCIIQFFLNCWICVLLIAQKMGHLLSSLAPTQPRHPPTPDLFMTTPFFATLCITLRLSQIFSALEFIKTFYQHDFPPFRFLRFEFPYPEQRGGGKIRKPFQVRLKGVPAEFQPHLDSAPNNFGDSRGEWGDLWTGRKYLWGKSK